VSAAGLSGGRWSARPWAARGLRVVVFGLPILASLALVQLLTSLTGVPTSSLWVFLAWWFGVSIAASVVVSALYALTRRLLPLSGLLGLALVFPDEAPSRFRLALAAGTVESLQDRLRSGAQLDAQEAAEILLQLVAALDSHDRITRGHAERVRGYAASLGRQIGLSSDDLDRLNWSALLHDIGKLEVDGAILNKPGRPTDEEWAKLRRHPLDGEQLVAPLRGWLGEWVDAIGYHHENWDGTGYPRGTAGDAIPLAGRIVAIADVYDVITSVRSYKEAATPAEARAELARCSGAQFDPRLVRAFVSISLGRMRFLVGPLAWLSNAPLLTRLPLTPSLGATIGGVAALATAATATPAGAEQPRAVPHHVPAVATRVVPVVAAPHDPSAVVDVTTRRRTRVHHAAVELHPGPTHAASPPPAPTTKPRVHTAAPSGTTTTTTENHPAAPPTTTTIATTTTTATTTPAAPNVPTTATTTTAAPPTSPTTTTTTTTTSTPASPPIHVNVAPSFTAGGNQTVLEDSGAHAVTSWATAISAGPSSESTQTVTFTVSTDNASLFSAAPAVSSNGTLSYTSAPDANGTAHVTVSAVDDGGTANGGHDTSASQSFTITVTALNDAPTFTPGANQTVVSLLGPQTVSGWATGISPGPPDESAQTVTFQVSTSNGGLFAVQPQISSSGTLTYTPKALALGSATVTVTPVDNGGSSNGGQDTGAPRTFTITII
jgi:hypothetical protein